MAVDGVSSIPGADGWQYGAFAHDVDRGMIHVPLVRVDGKTASFEVPSFLSDGEDLRRVALIVIGALEKWEALEGLGA